MLMKRSELDSLNFFLLVVSYRHVELAIGIIIIAAFTLQMSNCTHEISYSPKHKLSLREIRELAAKFLFEESASGWLLHYGYATTNVHSTIRTKKSH